MQQLTKAFLLVFFLFTSLPAFSASRWWSQLFKRDCEKELVEEWENNKPRFPFPTRDDELRFDEGVLLRLQELLQKPLPQIIESSDIVDELKGQLRELARNPRLVAKVKDSLLKPLSRPPRSDWEAQVLLELFNEAKASPLFSSLPPQLQVSADLCHMLAIARQGDWMEAAERAAHFLRQGLEAETFLAALELQKQLLRETRAQRSLNSSLIDANETLLDGFLQVPLAETNPDRWRLKDESTEFYVAPFHQRLKAVEIVQSLVEGFSKVISDGRKVPVLRDPIEALMIRVLRLLPVEAEGLSGPLQSRIPFLVRLFYSAPRHQELNELVYKHLVLEIKSLSSREVRLKALNQILEAWINQYQDPQWTLRLLEEFKSDADAVPWGYTARWLAQFLSSQEGEETDSLWERLKAYMAGPEDILDQVQKSILSGVSYTGPAVENINGFLTVLPMLTALIQSQDEKINIYQAWPLFLRVFVQAQDIFNRWGLDPSGQRKVMKYLGVESEAILLKKEWLTIAQRLQTNDPPFLKNPLTSLFNRKEGGYSIKPIGDGDSYQIIWHDSARASAPVSK